MGLENDKTLKRTKLLKQPNKLHPVRLERNSQTTKHLP